MLHAQMLCNPNALARAANSRPLALGITTQVRNIRQRMDPPINLVGNPGTYNKKVQVARHYNYCIFICYRIYGLWYHELLKHATVLYP